MKEIIANKNFWGTIFIFYGLCELTWAILFVILKKDKKGIFLKFMEFYFETIRPSRQRGLLVGGFFIFMGLLCLFR